MDTVNQKILDAIIAKAERVCPDSLSLIGVYGSVATGDTYEKSDLDLLILIRDPAGYQLATGFLLEDRDVGYDIYCTTWDQLRWESECHHAQLSKLLDSKILYVRHPEDLEELEQLREKARAFLRSQGRFVRVRALMDRAKIAYADALLQETPGQVRYCAGSVIYCLLDAVMLFHGGYYRRGIKRTFAELAALPLDPLFPETIQNIAAASTIPEIRDGLKKLLNYAENHFRLEQPKQAPSPDLAGTYEEMFSNWRNKVSQAAKDGDVFASWMNLCCLQNMLSEIAAGTEIGTWDLLGSFHPENLAANSALFDQCLKRYETVYRRAGLTIRRYPDVDAFAADYLGP